MPDVFDEIAPTAATKPKADVFDEIQPPDVFDEIAPWFDPAQSSGRFDPTQSRGPIPWGATRLDPRVAAAYRYTSPDFGTAAWWDRPAGAVTEVPSGQEITEHTGLPPMLSVPASAAAKTGASVVDYFSTPHGMTEAAASLTPLRPVIMLKWAKDMVQGGITQAKDLKEKLVGMAYQAINNAYARGLGQPATPIPHEDIQAAADDAVGVVLGIPLGVHTGVAGGLAGVRTLGRLVPHGTPPEMPQEPPEPPGGITTPPPEPAPPATPTPAPRRGLVEVGEALQRALDEISGKAPQAQDPRVDLLKQEGVSEDDAAALVGGTKTPEDVVKGEFAKHITPAWNADVNQSRGGHGEAWIAGYNDALARLKHILDKGTLEGFINPSAGLPYMEGGSVEPPAEPVPATPAAPAPAPRYTVPQVQAMVDELARVFPGAPKPVVVESPAQWPQLAHDEARRQGVNLDKGRAWRQGDQVFIAASNVKSPTGLARTFLHETAGHIGADRVLGPDAQRFYLSVFKRFEKSPLMDDLRKGYPNANPEVMGREVLGRLAEDPNLDRTLWQAVVARVRETLRRMGWKLEVTEGDVQEILRRAVKGLKQPERATAGRGFAADDEQDFFTRPESVEEQRAREQAEADQAERKRQREELAARSERKLTGTAGDEGPAAEWIEPPTDTDSESSEERLKLWKQHETAPGPYTVWLFANRGDPGRTGQFTTFKNKQAFQTFVESYPDLVSGRAMPERVFYRKGAPPESYLSVNRVTGQSEMGVSAYYRPQATSFAGSGSSAKWYYGKGRQVGIGSDGEPVIIPTSKWLQRTLLSEGQFAAGRLEKQDEKWRVGQRNPTAVSATERGHTHPTVVDIETMSQNPEALKTAASLIKTYNPEALAGKDPNALSDSRVVNLFKNHIRDNLVWLYRKYGEKYQGELVRRAKQWYDGARQITEDWSKRFEQPRHVVASVIATQSPKKDWFQNLALAERTLEIVSGPAKDSGWSQKMTATVKTWSPDVRAQVVPRLKDLQRKTWGEMDDYEKAIFVRAYSQANHPSTYHEWSPEGQRLDLARNKPKREGDVGEPTTLVWQSFDAIGKAISVIENPTLENISNQLGYAHKVRNFYNNILNPNNYRYGDVTIDTHANAAGLLKPLGQKAIEVKHSMGSTSPIGEIDPSRPLVPAPEFGPVGDDVRGFNGLYGIYADAYRAAADIIGVLPRELQSVTWEASRGLFSPEFKRNANALAEIDEIWHDVAHGRLSAKRARELIFDRAKQANGVGIADPKWSERGRGSSARDRGAGDAGQLSEVQLLGPAGGPERPGSRRGVRDPRTAAQRVSGSARAQTQFAAGGVDEGPADPSDWREMVRLRDEAAQAATKARQAYQQARDKIRMEGAAHEPARVAAKNELDQAEQEYRKWKGRLANNPDHIADLLKRHHEATDPQEAESLLGELTNANPQLVQDVYRRLQANRTLPPSAQLPEPFASLQELGDWLKTQRIDSPQRTLKDRLNIARSVDEKWQRTKSAVAKAWYRSLAVAREQYEMFRHPPVDTDFRALNKEWFLMDERSGQQTARWVAEVNKAIPQQTRRWAITAWLDAGGDRATLEHQRDAVPGKLRPVWEAALNLTADEIRVANQIRADWRQKLDQAKSAGYVDQGRQFYTPQFWKVPPRVEDPASGSPGNWRHKLDARDPFFSLPREHATYFDGILAGGVPDTMDVGRLLGEYNLSFNKALSSRAVLKAALDGVAKDGKPVTVLSGYVQPMDAPEGGEPPGYFVNGSYRIKNAVAADGRPYQPIDHPALHGWKTIETEGGQKIVYRSDMLVHPDHVTQLKNILGTSPLREIDPRTGNRKHPWIVSGLQLNRFLKDSKFALSPFHGATVAEAALGDMINPITKGYEIDLTNNPRHIGLVSGGLNLGFSEAHGLFIEGAGSHGGLVSYIPGLGEASVAITDFIFKDYLPKLKMKAAEKILDRNMARYKNKLTDEQIYELSAQSANALFGIQNYRLLGKSPLWRDLMSLAFTAPDFLLSRTKTVARAFKPHGAEERRSLLFTAAVLYVGARVINSALDPDNDPHWGWKDAFAIVANGKRYTLRSTLQDLWHALSDPRSFIYNRISPIARIAIEAATHRDWRGQTRNAYQQATDALNWVAPQSAEGFVPGATARETSIPEAIGRSVGVMSRRDTAQMRVRDLAKAWNNSAGGAEGRKHEASIEAETFPESAYRNLDLLLESGKLDAARREYERLVRSGEERAKIYQHFTAKQRAFTGNESREAAFRRSLTPDQVRLYQRAQQEHRDRASQFLQMIRGASGSTTPQAGP